MAPEIWLNEPVASVEPGPARFQSEVEAQEEEIVPFVEPTPAQHLAPVRAAEGSPRFVAEEPIVSPARPQFAELAEEPAFTPLPRGFALDQGGSIRGLAAQEHPLDQRPQPSMTPYPEAVDESQQDLETPAFMRRLQF